MRKLIKRVSGATRLIVSILLIAVSCQTVKAQTNKILGIDHIGINVPDIDQAVRFFSDVLGFVPVTSIGNLHMDDAWRKRYKIHTGAEVERIVMLRAGNGANIEVFQYKSPGGNREQPYNDDIGATHFALYSTDINASILYLKGKGVQFLNDPIINQTGPVAGETWDYFLTPWGSKIELISYPDGKAYEKANPAVKLWSPKDANANPKITDMDTAEIDTLITKHLLIWNETNTEKRTEAIKAVYNSNVSVVVPGLEFSGYAKLNSFIDGLLAKNAGYVFTHQRPIESHHNLARLFWSFGPPSQPNATTGMDLFIIENGRVQALYVFLDDPHK